MCRVESTEREGGRLLPLDGRLFDGNGGCSRYMMELKLLLTSPLRPTPILIQTSPSYLPSFTHSCIPMLLFLPYTYLSPSKSFHLTTHAAPTGGTLLIFYVDVTTVVRRQTPPFLSTRAGSAYNVIFESILIQSARILQESNTSQPCRPP